MTIFKCKMCGGTIEFEPGATVGVCDSCGTKQTFPRLDSDRRANMYDRANHFRRNNEFDKASGIYEEILNEQGSDAEAYWSLVLCRYGIEYVEDPVSHKRVPTVNRAQYTSIFDDDNYKSALRYADENQRTLYEEEAAVINEIQKGILAISQKEEPFDIFICYKETDNNGRRTPDSVLANDLYHQLTQEGFKVFFSRITLEDKLGTAYEPYIFAALNSAKVMVVLGTKPEYFNAVWVRNEWSRFLALVKQSRGKKVLIPAYKDMDPYDLPDEFSHLQAQDMSKLGFMQDLIRGIKKLACSDEPKPVPEQVNIHSAGPGIEPLLERAFLFLEDGNWQDADIYCEKVLDQDPKCARAYLGKLMAERHVRRREDFAGYKEPFGGSSNYQKAVRFGGSEMDDLVQFCQRNERDHIKGVYAQAVSAMNAAKTEGDCRSAAERFRSVSGYQDADSLAAECLEKAEICRKDAIYDHAKSQMKNAVSASRTETYSYSGTSVQLSTTLGAVACYEAAIRSFKSIPGWRDADQQVQICQRKIEEIKQKELKRRKAAAKAEKRAVKAAKRKNRSLVKRFFVLLRNLIILGFIFSFLFWSHLKKFEPQIRSFLQIEPQAPAVSPDREGSSSDRSRTSSGREGSSSDRNRSSSPQDHSSSDRNHSSSDRNRSSSNRESSPLDRNRSSSSSSSDRGSFTESRPAAGSSSPFTELKKAEKGSVVRFGTYKKGGNGSGGKEPIEWMVLAKKGDRILVISKDALDSRKYNDTSTDMTWNKCLLRTWLNKDFLENAFSSEERKKIVSTVVSPADNPTYGTSGGVPVTDKIFLLSIAEANQYFSSDGERKCNPTDYAVSRGAKRDGGFCWWWLRSPGKSSRNAAFVYGNGRVGTLGENVASGFGAVRPAMWIKP